MILRAGLLIAGILATLIGLLFAAQGSSMFPYPASSFMIDQSPWIWRGCLLAGVGLIAIFVSRRMRG